MYIAAAWATNKSTFPSIQSYNSQQICFWGIEEDKVQVSQVAFYNFKKLWHVVVHIVKSEIEWQSEIIKSISLDGKLKL